MQRYCIAQQDGEGNILVVIVQEEFLGGPPVGAAIPAVESNVDYLAFLAWGTEGNEPDPMEG